MAFYKSNGCCKEIDPEKLPKSMDPACLVSDTSFKNRKNGCYWLVATGLNSQLTKILLEVRIAIFI